MSAKRTPRQGADRDAAIRRRRGALLVVVLLCAVGAAAYLLRPSSGGEATAADPTLTMSAVDLAAQKAAAGAQAGAKEAQEIENRTWAIGPYASAVPPTDGVNAGTSSGGGVVALTFDDGPGRDTWDVLALLKRYKMHATFFVIGQNIADNPGVIEAAVRDGNVVGDHSMSHASLPSLDKAGLAREVDEPKQLIQQAAGIAPTLMRPPFGDFTGKTNEYVRSRGMLPVLWDVDSNDWALHDAQTIANNVLTSTNLKPGAIILLHDGSSNRQMTVNALPAILDGLVKRGLRSVTIPELLRQGPPSVARPGDYALSEYAKAKSG